MDNFKGISLEPGHRNAVSAYADDITVKMPDSSSREKNDIIMKQYQKLKDQDSLVRKFVSCQHPLNGGLEMPFLMMRNHDMRLSH